MNLILAHGFLGFRKVFNLEYFRNVKQHLEATFPLKVLVTEVDPASSITVRSGQLRRQILIALNEVQPESEKERRLSGMFDPAAATHLIGHSMGGLDGRALLSPANPDNLAGRIASLTTISTPHRGSPIADVIAARLDSKGLSLLERWFEMRLRDVLDDLGIPLEGLHDLTSTASEAFNQKYVNHPEVRYFSVAGAARVSGRPTAKILYPAYKYIKRKTGEINDGLVSIKSARWGEFDSELWPADHAEEVGHDLDHLKPPKNFDYLAAFEMLVARLQDATNVSSHTVFPAKSGHLQLC